MKAVFDTNILIDYLNGIDQARQELLRFDSKAISLITYMEVLAGAKKSDEEKKLTQFLRQFEVLPVEQALVTHVISIRRKNRIKLPDAIIWATAKFHQALLITRNLKGFPEDQADIRIPYRI